MPRTLVGGITFAALIGACSAPAATPLEVADAVFDVVGSETDPVPLAPVDDSQWVDIRFMTIMRTATDLEVTLELMEAPDPTGFMTYSIEIDATGDGSTDYSLWAEYFGEGTAQPGFVPWNAGEALFDAAYPGTLTVDERVIRWTVPLDLISGEPLRVAAAAHLGDAVLVAQDYLPDTQLNQTTRAEVYSWITVP